MKKIININFHGRVVPIEESALGILQQYVDSLRRYFANEEGRDEIVNDIENRFAELFSELLKKGSSCITDADVNSIITSMGRPEEFEQEERASGSTGPHAAGSDNTGFNTGTSGSAGPGSGQQDHSYSTVEPRRLYRSENDKILAGVCGGLANYLRLDPAIVRIIFGILGFVFGVGFPLYFVLWIVLPKKSLAVNIRKRLYRNPDDRMIAGVASGLANYFHIEVWIPRLIFSLPLIAGLITSVFRSIWFNFHHGPVFFTTGGFGGTLFVTYIVLWIVLPEAVTASEKLEMRGEKVDLESIKNTIKSDLEGFKGRARDMGQEMKERFQQAGEEMKQAGSNFANTAGPVVRSRSSGLGHAIGVLFKAFFLFIAGIISFVMIAIVVWLLFNGVGLFPFKNYLLSGLLQNFLALTSLILFLGIPIIALLIWLIRRIMGVRSRNNYIGYTLGSLWIIGIISLITLLGMIFNNFRSRASVEDEITLSPATPEKLLIRLASEKEHYYDTDWFGFDWGNNAPFYSLSEDTVMMNTVRVHLMKSPDAEFHVQRVRFSRGSTPGIAKTIASGIQFDIRQSDSVLYLPQGFAITKNDKFRNQQVLVNVSVPVGKKVWVSGDIDSYHWFTIRINHHNGFNDNTGLEWTDDWDNPGSFDTNTEYIMTEKGLKRTHPREKDEEDNDNTGGDERPEIKERPELKERPEQKEKAEAPEKAPAAGGGYRYKGHSDSSKPGSKNDSLVPKRITQIETPDNPASSEHFLSALFIRI